MSGLLFLSSQDFHLQEGTKGLIMCSGIPGFSLILFYSTHCPHCSSLIPIFKRLPGTISGCQFGMVNVSQNKECVKMSQNTIAPLKYVPYIVLYVNGRPFMVYKGPKDPGAIRTFVIDVANNIQKKQHFSKNANIKNKDKAIPEYCTGIPLCGEDGELCYLIESEAYKDTTKNKQRLSGY